MKIGFFSNFLNHHQLDLSKAFLRLTDEYHFVAAEPVPADKIALGYEDMNSKYPFVVRAYESDEAFEFAKSFSLNCDVVIIGSAPEVFIKDRIKQNKIVFRYNERLFKDKQAFYRIPMWIAVNFIRYEMYRNQYLLCASAYAASDFNMTLAFLNKTYKWGYFPEKKTYDDLNGLIESKTKNTILWAGRMIGWKHPEAAIYLAKELRNRGYDFSLTMIGTGPMLPEIEDMISKNGLSEHVKLPGAMSYIKVREFMEQSEVFVFTSDRQEGWGAVLNESMNSACAVVANDEIGAVPYLLKDQVNGACYHNGDLEELVSKTAALLKAPQKRKAVAAEAYRTITEEWNAEVAASRFIQLASAIMDGQKTPFVDGICSRA